MVAVRVCEEASDDDLDALVAYMTALRPAKHAVPEPELSAEARRRLGT